jgi:parvulin-like peptidyl-prolyl isomerase
MKTLRAALAVMLALGLVLGVAGCSNDEVAATVNGEEIMKSELDEQVLKLQEQYPQMFEGADAEARMLDFQQRLLDNLINSVLIRQAAEEMGIEISDSDVGEELDQLRAGFQDDAAFEDALAQAGMTVETLEAQVRDQLLTEALLAEIATDTEVTDEDIAAYYESNSAQFTEAAAVHASHILVAPEDKALAEEILADINAGGNFEALAEEHSIDSVSAANGGDLGWPTTPYVPEFQAAAEALEVGEVSGLVETTFGWHIIRLNDKRDSREMELDEVKDQIAEILSQQSNADAYQVFLDEQKESAEIVILIEGLELTGEEAAPVEEPVEE